MGDGIISRVNHLNEAVNNLERDLEHKVSAEELSAYLDMPLEEIRDLLRMSGDQIDVTPEQG
jgi:DNA-directed RNA polymerase specialized sigma subunit